MKLISPKYCISILLSLFCFFAAAQELPPIVNYTPSQYGADNQNWMLDQDAQGTMYSANNTGLLVFNGAQWELYPSPNATILRSVKVVGDKVYTGADMEFGFWKKDVDGIFQYVSLSRKLNLDMIEGEEIWNILTYRDKIVFQSFNRIYIYQGEKETIRHIDFENNIHQLFKVDDALYFQELTKGLYTLKNGNVSLFTNDVLTTTETFVKLFLVDDSLIGVSQNGKFFKITEKGVIAWQEEKTREYSDYSVYDAIKLSNNDIVLGTISNGVIVLNSKGEKQYQISQENGLGNNTALSLFEDADKNIWIGLDNGIDCINNHLPFSSYVDRDGKIGTTYTAVSHNGYRYLGTNQGLFYKKDNEDEFTLVTGMERQVWMLKVIDGALFCGHNKGTFIVNGENSTQISSIPGTWDIKSVPSHPEWLLQGNYTGLYLLEKKNNSWRVRNKIQGFDISTKFFEFVKSQKLLISNEYKGVFEIGVDSDFRNAISLKKNTTVQKGSHAGLVKYDGTVFYSNPTGIYQYDVNNETFIKHDALSEIYENEYVSGKLLVDNLGRLWAFTQEHLVYITKDNLEDTYAIKKIQLPQELRKTVKGYEHITPLDNKAYLLGTVDGYIVVNLSSFPEKSFDIHIQSVQKGTRGETEAFVSTRVDGNFAALENNVKFTYSIPEYDKYQIAEYKYKLEGIYDNWSSWSTASQVTYENLPSGKYVFSVMARVGDNTSSNISSYIFEIERPWYLSNLLIAIYLLLTLGIFVLVNWLYKRYYRKQRERLLENSKRELELTSLESEKALIELRNQNLQEEMSARNRELATSTMSMINKSKILNEIKDALSKENKDGRLDKVISLVDNNINNEDDWSFFEEAFNHADKDFFKKVKDKHPNLTANDLKLCVYLRLNMSSKEIAPLLNISHRSVEIKRYRLRKKINLPHEVNLNDYFIDL